MASLPSPLFKTTPAGFCLDDVVIRLARPEERMRWDETVKRYHYLGFKRFPGRGLRYIFEWRGEWIGLAGWQSGVFKCRLRDRWVRWKATIQFQRLHLVANNTRFLLLGEAGTFPRLGTHALSGMTQRLSADWAAHFGHGVLLAEAFVDPSRFQGGLYRAAGWLLLGGTRGFARASGRYTEPHGQPKDMYVRELQRNARPLLRSERELPAAFAANPQGGTSGLRPVELRSLYAELSEVPDFRRAQGRKHKTANVLAIYLLARLAGLHGGKAAAAYSQSLSQKELEALGAWRNPRTGRYEPVSRSVIYRVLENVDPEALEAVVRRYSTPRLQLGAALAADGKRVRVANRNGPQHHETVTLVAHGSGLPLASLGLHDQNGEIAAVRALFEEVPLAGRVVTLDALHTVRNTARTLVDTHRADYLLTVKVNAKTAFAALRQIDWEQPGTRCYAEEPSKGHGCIEQRSIRVLSPPEGSVNYPHLQQIFRIERERQHVASGRVSRETVYGMTSVSCDRGTPEQLLGWNRGHWVVENQNHRVRDVQFAEDACLSSKGHAALKNALCNCIAIAVILSSGQDIADG